MCIYIHILTNEQKHKCSVSGFLKHRVILCMGHVKGWLGEEEGQMLSDSDPFLFPLPAYSLASGI